MSSAAQLMRRGGGSHKESVITLLRFRACQSAPVKECALCVSVCVQVGLTTGVELHAGYGFVMSWEVSHHSLSVRVLTHQDLEYIYRRT